MKKHLIKVKVIKTDNEINLKRGERVGTIRSVLDCNEGYDNFNDPCNVFVNACDAEDLELNSEKWEKAEDIPSSWTYEDFQHKG